MSKTEIPEPPLIRSIFHPTDFSEESELAFAHALAIALVAKAEFRKLTILHACAKDSLVDATCRYFPSVGATLERWGLIEGESLRTGVFPELGLEIQNFVVRSKSPLSTILEYVNKHDIDLIVLATRGREGPPQWIQRSVAESLLRQSRAMTLFVPAGEQGFVALKDGDLSLRRLLLPVDHQPSPLAAIRVAARVAKVLGVERVEIALLHVGDSPDVLDFELLEDPAWYWTKLHRSGEIVAEIIDAADEISADAIVMATAGREGILDALRGSVKKHVLRHAPCPLLAVPEEWVAKISHGGPQY